MLLAGLLISAVSSCMYECRGGSTYGKTRFMDDVSVGSWSAIDTGNVTIATTSGGTYTNSTTYTNWYRFSATNLKGRLPVSSVRSYTFTGGTNGTNAVSISWPPYSGVSTYIIERSNDGGSSWTQWLALAVSTTNWTDTGTNSWTNSIFTNVYPVIAAPSVPWAPIGTYWAKDGSTGPATGDWDGGGNALTNWYKVQAVTGKFDKVVVSSNTLQIGDLDLGAGGNGSNLLVNGEAVTLKSTSDSLQSQLTGNDADIADLAGDNAAQDHDLAALAMWIAMEQDAERYALKRSIIYEFADTNYLDHGSCTNLYHDSGGDYIYSYYDLAEFSTNCVVYLRCDETNSSSTVTNYGTSGTDGTLWFRDDAHSPGFATNTKYRSVSGKIGTALYCERSSGGSANDGVAIGLGASYASVFQGGQITLSTWYKCMDGQTVGSAYGMLIGVRDAADNNYFEVLRNDTSTITFTTEANNNRDYVGSPANMLVDGENPWHHFAAVYDQDSGAFYTYKDGGLIATGTIANADFSEYAGAGNLCAGAVEDAGIGYQNRHADGYLDEWRLYDTALNQTEVQYLYNSGTGTTNHPTRNLGGNLTVISTPYYVDAAPSTGSLRIMGLTNTTCTLNTDIKGFISSDGGSTWDQVPLADEGLVYAESLAYRWWVGSTNYTGASTSLVWKVTTHNNKDDIRLISIGQGYDD